MGYFGWRHARAVRRQPLALVRHRDQLGIQTIAQLDQLVEVESGLGQAHARLQLERDPRAQLLAKLGRVLAVKGLLPLVGHQLLLVGGLAQLLLDAVDLFVLALEDGLLSCLSRLQLADLDQAFALLGLQLAYFALLLRLVHSEPGIWKL